VALGKLDAACKATTVWDESDCTVSSDHTACDWNIVTDWNVLAAWNAVKDPVCMSTMDSELIDCCETNVAVWMDWIATADWEATMDAVWIAVND